VTDTLPPKLRSALTAARSWAKQVRVLRNGDHGERAITQLADAIEALVRERDEARALAGVTPDLAEDYDGLRADNAQLRAALARAEAETAELRAIVEELAGYSTAEIERARAIISSRSEGSAERSDRARAAVKEKE